MNKTLYIEDQLSQNSQWLEVRQIIQALSHHSHSTVLVGGSVRDALLGLVPKDLDVATSAKPEEILKIFPQAKLMWAKYGVTLLPLKNIKKSIELTTFRKESQYQDGRRPDSIEFCSMKEDVKRRDFTINGLYYDIEKKEVIDLVNGLQDLQAKILRTIGNPEQRFKEDHLRVLRAARFSHQLKLTIEEKTKKAMHAFSQKLNQISQERITSELIKMFFVDGVEQGLKLLNEYNMLNACFHLPDQCLKEPFVFWNQDFSFCKEAAYFWTVVGLPYFNQTESFKNYLNQLKIPASENKKSLFYFNSLKELLSDTPLISKFKILNKGNMEELKELCLLWCKSYEISSEKFQQAIDKFNKIKPLPESLITSSDLFKEGYSEGPQLRLLLDQSFKIQIENPQWTKQEILKKLKEIT